MRHYKPQSGQVGRIFRKGSFFDRLLHVVVPFFGPEAAGALIASDNIGNDNGWFSSKPPTPPNELNYARTKQQISGIKNKYQTPKVF